MPLQRDAAAARTNILGTSHSPHNVPAWDGSRERGDLDHAVNSLRRSHPELSAGEAAWRWQKWTLALLPPACLAAALIALDQLIFALAALLVLPFFCVVALRTAALWHTAFGSKSHTAEQDIETHPVELPRYTLLVPLYDEAGIVRDLVSALSAID